MINGSGKKQNNLLVQKSHPLMKLSELSLAEFKILDVYLSRINSRNPEDRTVCFEKGELEELLGVKRIRAEVLDKRMDNLMTNINIPDDSPKGYSKIALFEKTHLRVDENGIWTVEMTCTNAARKYIFNIEEIGYIKYRLHNILKLKSRYSYVMFLYLEDNRFRKEWKISLVELKKMLHCDKEELYGEFKYFNQRVLKNVHKEINEKTDCKYNYETVTKGKSVVAIKFNVESNNRYIMEDEEIDEENYKDSDFEELWKEALSPLGIELSKEKMEELYSIIVTIPECKIPYSPASYGNMALMRFHYLDQKVREIMRRDKDKTIANKYLYLLKVMKRDADLK